MTGHLTPEARARYLRGTLAPDEFLEADDHLAGCAECRQPMAPPLAHVAESFREALHGPHLTYEQLEALAGGGDDAGGHLASCAACTAELEDLRRMPGEPRPQPWWSWAAAAAIAVAVLSALPTIRSPWLPQRQAIRTAPAPIVTPAPAPAPPPAPALSGELAEVLRRLAGGELPSAPLVEEFRAATERVRGVEGGRAPLTVLSPLGVVEETRPLFRWRTRRGATYVAEVFDHAYRSVARSGVIRGGSWRPARPLARDAEYSWQVTETRGAATITVPEPPSPPARFRVIGAAAAAELANARSALARALIYAREGVVDRALEEMQNVREATPEVRRAVETLRRYQAAPTTTNPPQ